MYAGRCTKMREHRARIRPLRDVKTVFVEVRHRDLSKTNGCPGTSSMIEHH